MGWHFSTDKQQHPDFKVKRQAPRGPVVLDVNHPLYSALDEFYLPMGDRMIALKNGEHATTTGTSLEIDTIGKHVSRSESDAIDAGAVPAVNDTGYNFSAIQFYSTTDSAHTVMSRRDGGTTQWQWYVWAAEPTITLKIGTTNNTLLGTFIPSKWSDGEPHVIGLSTDSSTGYLYYEGDLENSASLSGTASSTDTNLAIGSRWASYPTTGFGMDAGKIYCTMLFNRALTAAEHKSLADDPFQLLRPAVPLQYYVASAAAGSYFVDLDKRQHPDFHGGGLPGSDRVVLDYSSPIVDGLWDCRLYDKGNVRNIAGIEIDNPGGTISHTFDEGRRGLDFDGSSQKIDLNPVGDKFEAYTKYAIAKPGAFALDNIISGNTSNQHAFWFDDTNELQAGHDGAWNTVFKTGLTAGNIYTVAVTFDGSTLKLFLDGEEVDSAAASAPSGSTPAAYIASYDGGFYGQHSLYFTAIWDRALSPEEVKSLYKREALEILKPAVPLQYFTGTAAGGDTNVLATSDSLTLTEYPATVNAETSITAGVDALTLTEYNATVSAGTNIAAGVDALTLTEYAATVNAETNVNAGFDALAITEYQASVTTTSDTNVAAGVDNLVLTEYQATIKADNSVAAGFDALVITEYSATVTIGANISASTDSLALTEYAATIKADTSVSAGLDALTLTEYAASISSGGALTAHHTVYATAKKMTTRANAKKMTVTYHG